MCNYYLCCGFGFLVFWLKYLKDGSVQLFYDSIALTIFFMIIRMSFRPRFLPADHVYKKILRSSFALRSSALFSIAITAALAPLYLFFAHLEHTSFLLLDFTCNFCRYFQELKAVSFSFVHLKDDNGERFCDFDYRRFLIGVCNCPIYSLVCMPASSCHRYELAECSRGVIALLFPLVIAHNRSEEGRSRCGNFTWS